MVMTNKSSNWTCPAIDHGIAIFPDGKIRPCCQVSAEYSKSLDTIKDPNRFADIKSETRPEACRACWSQEDQGFPSYRNSYQKSFNKEKSGIQFLDIRNTNQCNLKCRYCSPHFSNQWAKELAYKDTLIHTPIESYLDDLLTDDLIDIYWCGGEPLISQDHYMVLEKLIAMGLSHKVKVRYNSNFTVLKYKTKDIFDLWKNFKSVHILISIDAVGEINDYIRSGSNWKEICENILKDEESRTLPGRPEDTN